MANKDRVLYFITHPSHAELLSPCADTHNSSVILLQDAVSVNEVAATTVYVLEEDIADRNMTSLFPHISYEVAMRLIFDVDRVVVL